MRNITGSPVESSDFFDRPRDLDRFQRELANGANLLLTAPRRVGKTSFVLRLCELERAAGRSAVFMNVEGCHDELAFAERLVDGLSGSGLQPEALSSLTAGGSASTSSSGGVTRLPPRTPSAISANTRKVAAGRTS